MQTVAADTTIRLTCHRCGVYEEHASRGATAAQWSLALGWFGSRDGEAICPACAGLIDTYTPFTNSTPWSWSLIEGFEICPARYNATKVAKTHPEPPGPALARGNEVHQALEDRVTRNKPLPPELARFEPMLASFQAAGATAEASLCLTASMQSTAWFGKGAWVRAKLDLKVKTPENNLLLVDYKTGKFKPEAGDQLKLACAVGQIADPTAVSATAVYVWIDEPNPPPRPPVTMDFPTALRTIADFRKRLVPFVIAKQSGAWAKTPGWACKFCPLLECQHNHKR